MRDYLNGWKYSMLKKYFCYLSFLKYFSSLTFSCVNVYAHGDWENEAEREQHKRHLVCCTFFFHIARKLDNIAVIDAYIMLWRSIQLGFVTLLLNIVDKNGSFGPAVTHFWGGLGSLLSIPNAWKIIYFLTCLTVICKCKAAYLLG